MKEILIYSFETILCSGIFLLFYKLFLDRRASFGLCRVYLGLSAIASATIPALRIPVWQARIVELPPMRIEAGDIFAQAVIAPDKATPIWIWIYSIVTTVALAAMVWQLFRIYAYRRNSVITRTPGYNLAENPKIKSPFSFMRTIFVVPAMPGEELMQVISHETSHIRHRHSVEVLLMEFLKTIFWFNPFIWIMRRALTEVHEYQADRDVLDMGYDPVKYQTLIFRQLFGCNPELTNGLSHSRTKKRFLMMKNNRPGRYTLLKIAAVLPLTAVMMMLFSFTRHDTVFVMPQDMQTDQPKPEPVYTPTDTTIFLITGYGDIKDSENSATVDVESQAANPDNIILRVNREGHNNGGKPVLVINGNVYDYQGGDPMTGVDRENIASISIWEGGVRGMVNGVEMVETYGEQARNGVILITTKDAPAEYVATMHIKAEEARHLAEAEMMAEKENMIAEMLMEHEANRIHTVARISDSTGDGSPRVIGYYTYKKTEENQSGEKPSGSGGISPIKLRSNGQEPILLLDGKVIDEKTLENIDQNTIESITVLKDINVESMYVEKYGDTARNGVIIIQTKNGTVNTTEADKIHFDAVLTAPKSDATGKTEAPFEVVEEMPKFEGSDLEAFRRWIMTKLQYPVEAVTKGLQGRVTFEFVVDKDGGVRDFKVLASPDKILSDEVQRVVALSPKWTPGRQKGKSVSVRFVLPVDFKLSKPEPAK